MLRNTLHAAMTALLLLVMDYRFTGNALHEIGGLVLMALFMAHNAIHWRWYVALLRGKQNRRRVLMAAVNLLLLIAALTAFITGALVSVVVFAPLGLRGSGLFVHVLHQGAVYACFVLTAVHLGLHWRGLAVRLRRWLRAHGCGQGGIATTGRFVSLLVVGYGLYAAFVRRIGEKLLLQHSFDWNEAPTLWGFLLDYAAILVCCAIITHALLELPRGEKS